MNPGIRTLQISIAAVQNRIRRATSSGETGVGVRSVPGLPGVFGVGGTRNEPQFDVTLGLRICLESGEK